MEKDQIKGADFGCRTDFLFSTPSFLSGMGSAINIAGNYFEFNRTSDPDRITLKSDFCLVGKDLQNAIDNVLNDYQLHIEKR